MRGESRREVGTGARQLALGGSELLLPVCPSQMRAMSRGLKGNTVVKLAEMVVGWVRARRETFQQPLLQCTRSQKQNHACQMKQV